MSSPFTIRPACSDDVPAIARIDRAAFGGVSTGQIALAFKRIRKDGAKLLVAERDDCDDEDETLGSGAIVGHVGFWVHQRHVELFTLAVDPRWRGQGIARALLARVASGLARHRCILASVRVPVDNGCGVTCFLKCGWKAQPADELDVAAGGTNRYERATVRFEWHTPDPGLAVLRSILGGVGQVVRA